MALIDSGTKQYSSQAFSDQARYAYSFVLEYNEGGTAVVGRRYKLDVWDYVSDAAGDTDAELSAIFDLLCEPRQRLQFSGVGMGTIDSGGASGVDLEYGPKPEMVQWVPVGSHRCAYYHWRVKGFVPCCTPSSTAYIAAMEYDQEFSYDRDLNTTITTTGYIKIRPTTSDRIITMTADDFRGSIDVPLRTGFFREQKFKLLKDKITLQFTFIDTELEHPLPEGMTGAEGEQVVQNKDFLPTAASFWASTLSATFRLAHETTKAQALHVFRLMLAAKLASAANIPQQPLPNAKPVSFRPMLGNVVLRDNLFKREVSFSVTWLLLASFDTVIEACGLFKPVTYSWAAGGYQRWKALLPGLTNPYGSSGARAPSSEVIVSFCDGQSTTATAEDFAGVRPWDGGPAGSLDSPGQGVIMAQMGVTTSARHNSVMAKRSPVEDLKSTGRPNTDQSGYFWGCSDTPMSESGSGEDPVQTLSTSTPTGVLWMKALGVGRPVPPVLLEQVGGKKPVGIGQDVCAQWLAGAFGGAPVWATVVRREFEIPSKPEGITSVEQDGNKGRNPMTYSPQPAVAATLRRGQSRGGTFSNGTFSGSGPTFANGQFGGSGPAFRGGITNPFKKLTP